MINLRYHIVSITAVFLALGIGVALGGTFLDQATVDVLNRNIRNAEERISETNAENRLLEQQLREAEARDEALTTVGAPYLVPDQLTGRPVLLVAAPGVDQDEVEGLLTLLAESGADVQGTLELRDSLLLADDVDAELAAAVGLVEPGPAQLRSVAHARLRSALLAAGSVDVAAIDDEEGSDDAEGVPGQDEEGTEDPVVVEVETEPIAQAEVLRVLLERDYVDFVEPPDVDRDDAEVLTQTGHRYVFVGGADLTDEQNELLLGLLPETDADGRLAATVTSPTQRVVEGEEPPSPTIVARVRTDDARRDLYSTVDELDTFAGLVAILQTLVQMDEAAPDHYGQGEGASAVLPPGS
jgi:hypothetical protein